MRRNRIEPHPDEYRQDLNPNYEAGDNRGPARYPTRTAFDLKEVHRRYRDLRDDELKQIPIIEEGARLAEGATYFDLRYPERGELKALGRMTAGPDNWYVPKADVDYRLWNLITGVDDPARMGELVQP